MLLCVKRANHRWRAPKDMDAECVELCRQLNRLPGIETTESCCGHGKRTFCIWFRAHSLRDLPRLLYWFDQCHTGEVGWQVIAQTDCGMSPVRFRIEGPLGKEGYEGAEIIANLLKE